MRLAIVLLAALCASPLALGRDVPEDHWGRNLVPNPGFERDADGDGQPDGWSLPPGHCAWDAATRHGGEHSLRFTNAEPETYRLVTAPVPLLPGVRYRVSAWVKGEGVHDGDAWQQGAGICIEWHDADGKWLGGHYPKCREGTFEWARLGGESPPLPPEAARAHVVLYLRKGNVGTAWFDDVAVRALRGPAFSARLVRPAYRATVEAATDEKPIAVQVRLNRREHALPAEGLDLEAELRDPAGRLLARFPPRPAPPDEGPARMAWRLPALPLGAHTLRVRLAARRPVAERQLALRVAMPLERKVRVDERRRLAVDGEPFFPLGLYLGPTEDEHLARIAEAGFNTILCYGYGAGKEPRAYLDRAREHGLKVIYSIKDFYEGTRYYPRREGMSDIELVRRTVGDLRDHPALLAWYTNDELGPEWLPKLRAAYRLVCRLDPHHPAFQVLCRPGEFDRYYAVTDILGCDPYPVPRHPVTMVGEWMDTAHRAMATAKPVWCVPQIFRWANYTGRPQDREPTFAEKRAMAALALIHRAQGLVFYSYYDLRKGLEKGTAAPPELFDRRWREASAIARMVRGLIPALLEGREVAARLEGEVRYRVLDHGGQRHVIAVNAASEPRSVRIEPPTGGPWERRLGPLETVVEAAK
ncbi:MAG: hypothetical protein ACLF0G_03030 [Candidatus Brocadiia bacterium]